MGEGFLLIQESVLYSGGWNAIHPNRYIVKIYL